VHGKESGPVLHGLTVPGVLGQSVCDPPTPIAVQISNAAPLPSSPAMSVPLFINTERGAESMSMQEGFIPSSPVSFEHALTKPLHPSVIATPPPKRR
jgi:hypothetical protein